MQWVQQIPIPGLVAVLMVVVKYTSFFMIAAVVYVVCLFKSCCPLLWWLERICIPTRRFPSPLCLLDSLWLQVRLRLGLRMRGMGKMVPAQVADLDNCQSSS